MTWTAGTGAIIDCVIGGGLDLENTQPQRFRMKYDTETTHGYQVYRSTVATYIQEYAQSNVIYAVGTAGTNCTMNKDGNFYVQNTCYAGGVALSSDRRLKDDIIDVDLSSIFDAVEPKHYSRNDKGGERRVGFIAQDIEAATLRAGIPNTFTSTQHDGMLGLDYSRLVTCLWSKLKQVENRLAVLEKKRTKSK